MQTSMQVLINANANAQKWNSLQGAQYIHREKIQICKQQSKAPFFLHEILALDIIRSYNKNFQSLLSSYEHLKGRVQKKEEKN